MAMEGVLMALDKKMMDSIEKQNKEFDALDHLIKAYRNLPPVVDDDYPEMRHYYESSMNHFISAIRNNGRIK